MYIYAVMVEQWLTCISGGYAEYPMLPPVMGRIPGLLEPAP